MSNSNGLNLRKYTPLCSSIYQIVTNRTMPHLTESDVCPHRPDSMVTRCTSCDMVCLSELLKSLFISTQTLRLRFCLKEKKNEQWNKHTWEITYERDGRYISVSQSLPFRGHKIKSEEVRNRYNVCSAAELLVASLGTKKAQKSLTKSNECRQNQELQFSASSLTSFLLHFRH